MTFQWRNLLIFMLISVVLLWQVFVFLFMTYSKSYQTLLIGEHVWWFKKKIQFIVSMYNSVLLLEISNIFNTTLRKGHNYGCLNCSVHVYHSWCCVSIWLKKVETWMCMSMFCQRPAEVPCWDWQLWSVQLIRRCWSTNTYQFIISYSQY